MIFQAAMNMKLGTGEEIKEKTSCFTEQNIHCIIPLFQINTFYKTLEIIHSRTIFLSFWQMG
jgi:hypothetical protein